MALSSGQSKRAKGRRQGRRLMEFMNDPRALEALRSTAAKDDEQAASMAAPH
jgi:hypothetical protein